MGGIRPARRLLLVGMLLLVVAASAGPNEITDSTAVVAAVEGVRAPVASTGDDAVQQRQRNLHGEAQRNLHGEALIDLSRLTRAKSRQAARDPFAPRSFYTPPSRPARAPAPAAPVTAAPPPPPAPTAPPLPFTYMGKMTDDPQRPMFFLVKAGNLYNVRLGEVIDGTYRIDRVVGSSLRLIYLPLDIEQSLPMGDS
ncbi:MAG: hypothetical protein JSU95_13275 [Betaproteobacteria bacterium]|nr:MAG: hypothetical protein JSU95_13275 [Betaproteobacteria bacterium]